MDRDSKKLPEIKIAPDCFIGGNHPTFIVAEIGQNHQGSFSTAKEMIEVAKQCGVDCVKFQKSDLKAKFTKSVLNRPYHSVHSWGDTYGEHKAHLEFSREEYIDLQKHAAQCGVYFTASAMDEVSLDFLTSINVPFIKIGSGDTNNLFLLECAARTGRPLVISTGMSSLDTVKKVYELVRPLNPHLCILQCTSSYPTSPADVNLNVIQTYKTLFPDAVIGYSGHEEGTEISVAAVALGAKLIERHFTLNKTWKGNDHMASLLPEELKLLVKQIRTVEQALGKYDKKMQDSEVPCYNKLGKSVVAKQAIPCGTVISREMLDIKVAQPRGWKAECAFELVGKTTCTDIEEDESITEKHVLD